MKKYNLFNKFDRISYKRDKNLEEYKNTLIGIYLFAPILFIIMQIINIK